MREIRVRKSYEKEGFKEPVFEYRPDWPYISIGFGNERDYFIENLSLLISSGMGISAALSSLSLAVKTWKMKKITKVIESMVNAGMPLWRSFEETKILPERVISLIRSGEEAGRLADHLNLVTLQGHKEKVFQSRLRGALLYPGIVLSLAVVVALGSAWLVLPKLISVFTESKGALPLTTQILLHIGAFFGQYGPVAVPSAIIGLGLLIYGLFFFKKTKFIGDYILFHIPGVKDLVQGLELARFGYIFGVLLQAGFQVNESLESVKKGTNYASYRKFYDYLQTCVTRGESFNSALANFHKAERFIPIPIQQLIMSAEKSGKLSETFFRIGVIFEEKTDAMSRDLATVLEPIVLIIVGLIVAFIVMAIIGPIYGLTNQIN
jgi:type II secretory pathway component PulF